MLAVRSLLIILVSTNSDRVHPRAIASFPAACSRSVFREKITLAHDLTLVPYNNLIEHYHVNVGAMIATVKRSVRKGALLAWGSKEWLTVISRLDN